MAQSAGQRAAANRSTRFEIAAYRKRALELLELTGLKGFEANIPTSFPAACNNGSP
jgi:hypothetical protein